MRVAILVLALVGCAHAPPAPPGAIVADDLPARLYCVDAPACSIYRAAQPTPAELVALRDRLNVRTVIKLNRPSLLVDGPRDDVPAGVTLRRFPLWPAGPADHDELVAAVDALDDCVAPLAPGAVLPGGRAPDDAHPARFGSCLLHCSHGVDRTGLVVALWRVRHGSSPAAAYAEWRAFGRDEGLVLFTRAFERETGWRAP